MLTAWVIFVNPDTEDKYNVDKSRKAPKLLREFLWPLQGLKKSVWQRCVVHVLGNTVGRFIPYPKIFLKRPINKPNTYSIKEWCDHIKLKIDAMREISGFLPEMHLFHADGNVNLAN